MSELERRLHASVRADSAVNQTGAPRKVRRAIGRVRALKVAALGVLAVVALGAVAYGGLELTDNTASTQLPSPTPTPDLSLDQGSRGYATVDLPSLEHPQMTYYETGLDLCGLPVPEPTNAEGDFTADFDMPHHVTLERGWESVPEETPTGYVKLSYNGDEPLPAFLDHVTMLLIRDEMVVGFTTMERSELTTFSPERDEVLQWRWRHWVSGCDFRSQADMPPEGDYEVAWVARVHHDLPSAAVHSLRLEGYGLPAATTVEAFQAGSYRCSQWHLYHDVQPLTCAPTAVVGFELDEQAGTATVPYDTALYSHDVDVLLVSESASATLKRDPSGPAMPRDLFPYDPEVGPVCGEFYSDLGHTAQVDASWPPLRSAMAAGDTIEASLWLASIESNQATVTVPLNPRIWLTQQKQVDTELDDGATLVRQVGHEVVGWIDTTTDESQITISGYDGPSPWPMTVTEVEWCEGADRGQAGAIGAPDQTMGIIAATTTVELEDGTQKSAPTLSLHVGGRP